MGSRRGPELLSVPEVAARLSVGRMTVYLSLIHI